MVVTRYLEPILEPVFHEDSYGYQPGRSAHQALSVARQRCWRFDWVLDLDIKGFFDNIDWTLLIRAVRRHTACKWVLLYIERWLKAPVCMPDGTLVNRDKGTPQGAVVSPILANLFLHYAFDRWMREHYPQIPFERYADDVICHCRNEAQADSLRRALEARLGMCKLELHPPKTKIVYARMQTDAAALRSNDSISWVTRLGPGHRCGVTAGCSLVSLPRSAMTQPRRCGTAFSLEAASAQ